MALKGGKFGLAFAPATEPLVFGPSLHWLFACDATVAVELGVAATATERRSRICHRLGELQAAAGIAAHMPQGFNVERHGYPFQNTQ
jgi:hypothetical protein